MRAAVSVLAVAFVVAAIPVDAVKPPKACKQCRVQCREEATLTACIQTDPRLGSCPQARLSSCLKRARRDCKRNLKKCCSRQCRTTGLVQCCGSSVSSTPGSGPGVGATTTTVSGATTTTSTTVPGRTPCTSDADCPTCQCCIPGGTCGGATGASVSQCCNDPAAQPPQCGPKSPSACPVTATCPPPGQLLGGTYYWCAYCAGSNDIIEVLVPSGSTPPISFPSNACTRR